MPTPPDQPAADANPGDEPSTGSKPAPDRTVPEPTDPPDATPDGTLERAIAGNVASIAERAGDAIGPYRLLQMLGEGGFGSVFMAEQERPVIRRVALKIIKLGMDTRQVVARFEQERQALAMMDHPNIAKVLDAGSTKTGRPFFVMELVRGEPITMYCDRHNLSIHERLELFTQICQAVQHAHHKGVIHRDIKPSNILVTVHDTGAPGGRPIPKIIDFGIAKATSARLTNKTLFTQHRELIGTPEYMSPEQAEGSLDVDTRADVYSLGVLLYELLTGSTPFDTTKLRTASYADIQKMIREVEPPSPSDRLTASVQALPGVAAHRRMEPRRLHTLVRGELDWIVMKALEKDRTRRYETANGLGMDVQRYLKGEPILAAPPSRMYRVRKFARRYRGPVVVSALLTCALLAGLGGTGWGMRRAQRERDKAQLSAQRFEAMNAFLNNTLSASDPLQGGSDSVSVSEAMLHGVSELDKGAFREQPEAEIGLRLVIAEILRNKGRGTESLAVARRALELSRDLRRGDHLETASAMNQAALAYLELGNPIEAERLLVDARDMRRRLGFSEDLSEAQALNNLGGAYLGQAEFTKAEKLIREALEIRQRLRPGDSEEVASSLNNLALALQNLKRLPEAEEHFKRALEMSRRLHPSDHALVAKGLNNVGFCMAGQERFADAEGFFVAALEMNSRLFSGDHRDIAASNGNIGFVRLALDRAAEAEAPLRAALAMYQRLIEGDSGETANAQRNLARCLAKLGKRQEALELATRAAQMASRALSSGHPIRKKCDDLLAELQRQP